MKKIFSRLRKSFSRPLGEFLNEEDEWHALLYGFVFSWKGLRKEKIPDEAKKTIEKEHHYYVLGFFIGRAVQVAIVIICGVTITL